MPIPSAVLTEKIVNHAGGVDAAKLHLWENTRYLVAQRPADPKDTTTMEGFYKGCSVVPGPKSNPKATPSLSVLDLSILEEDHFIRFWDNIATDGATEDIMSANYGIMTKEEADEYEEVLLAAKKKQREQTVVSEQ